MKKKKTVKQNLYLTHREGREDSAASAESFPPHSLYIFIKYIQYVRYKMFTQSCIYIV